MRLSTLRFVEKFVRSANYRFENKTAAKKEFWKFVVVQGGFVVGLTVYCYFFIYPTPDIRFDIKRALFPSFETFIRTHGFVENDYMFERNIRSIQFHEKELKTMQNKRGAAEEATYINIES